MVLYSRILRDKIGMLGEEEFKTKVVHTYEEKIVGFSRIG